ncbi:hypothetical protein, partial [Pseudogemmobacter sonorensis]|uniref:hypothetical protein n=1 Tax=Pseudogemmobacter sonorensis TaxID=2989681 RepID=UPI0036D021BD
NLKAEAPVTSRQHRAASAALNRPFRFGEPVSRPHNQIPQVKKSPDFTNSSQTASILNKTTVFRADFFAPV